MKYLVLKGLSESLEVSGWEVKGSPSQTIPSFLDVSSGISNFNYSNFFLETIDSLPTGQDWSSWQLKNFSLAGVVLKLHQL